MNHICTQTQPNKHITTYDMHSPAYNFYDFLHIQNLCTSVQSIPCARIYVHTPRNPNLSMYTCPGYQHGHAKSNINQVKEKKSGSKEKLNTCSLPMTTARDATSVINTLVTY